MASADDLQPWLDAQHEPGHRYYGKTADEYRTMRRSEASRPTREWPAWIDDVLAFGPIAELETEWQAAIGDAITRVLDLRNGSRQVTCPCCGVTAIQPKGLDASQKVDP